MLLWLCAGYSGLEFKVPVMTTIAIRVKPGSSRQRVGGSYEGPHGRALIVAVTERAVDGQATEAAIRAVAKALGIKRKTIMLRTGMTSRDKVLAVNDPPADFNDRLHALLVED
jgi:uncharacterized protein YggU (UPF0235/DUF167 family)